MSNASLLSALSSELSSRSSQRSGCRLRSRHTPCRLRAHPIAERTMKAQDIMTRNPTSVSPETNVREAANIMKRENVGIVPVVEREGEKLIGVVTDRDIAIRCIADGRDGSCRVSEVMTKHEIFTCHPDDDVEKVMNTMGRE